MILKRVIIAVALIVLLSAAAHAEYKEKVHDEWQQHKSNFTINDKFFEVRATETPTRALISVDSEIIDVENNTCVEKLNMSICITDVDYPGEGLHSLFDPYDFRFYVEVYYYLAKLDISRTIMPTTLTIGEKAEIETIILNNGSNTASSIEFIDSFPLFDIDYVYGCVQKGHNLTWEGTLKAGRSKKCIYWIRATNTTSFSSIARAKYLEGIGNRAAASQSPAITIDVPKVELKMNLTVGNSSLWSGENASLSLQIENLNSENSLSSLFLTLSIPDSMSILEYSPEFALSGKTLNWNSNFGPSEKANFTAVLRAEKSGNYSITSSANYRFGRLLREVEDKKGIKISIDRLELQDIVYNATVRPGEKASFIINLINPSPRYSFRDINVTAKTNLPVNITHAVIEEMLQKRFVNVMDFSFTAPMWEDPTTYTTTFDIYYESRYNEKLHLHEERKFKVDPKKEKPASTTPKKDDNVLGVAKEKIMEDIEKIGKEKIVLIVVIALFLFIGSAVNFIRKAKKKVSEYEV